MTTSMTMRVPLQEWANDHVPEESLIYSGGYWQQVMFVRDQAPKTLATSIDDYREIRKRMCVIGTHTSKSVSLPVYSIELEDGTTFTLRYNFHNWKVSVDSPQDVEADFADLFDAEDAGRINPVYCEGFPPDRVYGPYAENKRQFTVELQDEFQVYMFFWIFARYSRGTRLSA